MKRSDAENGGPIGHRGPGLHDDKMDRFRKFADNLVGRSGPGHDDEKDRPKKSRGNDRRKGGGQRKGKGRRGRKGRGGSRPSRPEVSQINISPKKLAMEKNSYNFVDKPLALKDVATISTSESTVKLLK